MKVALLTTDQKNAIVGKAYDSVQLFAPFQDCDGNWCISVEEVNQCTNASCMFVKELPLIDYIAKPINLAGNVNFDKQNGLALSSIAFYDDKLVLFRANETKLEMLVSELDNTGTTHLNNTLGIINKANYNVIYLERSMGWFKVVYADNSTGQLHINQFTPTEQKTFGQAALYFMNLLNP